MDGWLERLGNCQSHVDALGLPDTDLGPKKPFAAIPQTSSQVLPFTFVPDLSMANLPMVATSTLRPSEQELLVLDGPEARLVGCDAAAMRTERPSLLGVSQHRSRPHETCMAPLDETPEEGPNTFALTSPESHSSIRLKRDTATPSMSRACPPPRSAL